MHAVSKAANYRFTYGGMLGGTEERDALLEVVKTNHWPLYKQGELMEKESAEFIGKKYGILFNSGSSAGLCALTALELPRGSEVIIPAVTFPTIFNIILQCNLTPVVVDSKIGTYNLDANELEQNISEKTRVIIAVHAVGNPCDMPAIMRIAKKLGDKYGHKIYVMEDNCDGWGGTIGARKVGSFGDVSFTSFHAAHIVSMGQGGGVFVDDKELARKVRMYRDWGRQSDIPRRTNGKKWPNLPEDYDARFIYEKVGYNLGPLELQAAMGRVQLRKTGMIKERRRRNYEYLRKELSQFPDLIMPTVVKDADPSWFSFPLSTLGERGPLVEHLENNGVETRSMFAGNILKHPAYETTPAVVRTPLAQANWILEHSFWITCHPRYEPEDLKELVDLFKDYYARTS